MLGPILIGFNWMLYKKGSESFCCATCGTAVLAVAPRKLPLRSDEHRIRRAFARHKQKTSTRPKAQNNAGHDQTRFGPRSEMKIVSKQYQNVVVYKLIKSAEYRMNFIGFFPEPRRCARKADSKGFCDKKNTKIEARLTFSSTI